MREVSTDLNILIVPSEWEKVLENLPATLSESGFVASEIHSQIVDLTCEPDNMLVTQFSQLEGHPPIVEVLHRLVINGSSDLELKDLTKRWWGRCLRGPTGMELPLKVRPNLALTHHARGSIGASFPRLVS